MSFMRPATPCDAGVVVAVAKAVEVTVGAKSAILLTVITFPGEATVDGLTTDVGVVLHADASATAGAAGASARGTVTTGPVAAPHLEVTPRAEGVGVTGLAGFAAPDGSAAVLGLIVADAARASEAAGILVGLAAGAVVAASLATTMTEGGPLGTPDAVKATLHDVVASVVRLPSGWSFGLVAAAADIAIP